MKCFCENCNALKEYDAKQLKEEYTIYNDVVETEVSVAVCKSCGSIMFNEEFDSANLKSAQNLYRLKHKLLTTNQIIEIRKKYGLSQRSFAKLLDWGDKTIRRYESGALQSRAHNSLLMFLQNPDNMQDFISQNEITLDKKKLLKLKERLNSLNNNKDDSDYEYISKLFSSDLTVDNGYKHFDFDKFALCVLYFIEKNSELLIVKLNKLLNYADMLFYKINGVSLTGIKYIHLPYGPVPDQYNLLYALLEKRGLVYSEYEQLSNGYEKHLLRAGNQKLNLNLTKEEINVLDMVNNKFVSFGSKQIADYSHNERGYKETLQGQVISYDYAKDITI